MPRVSEKTAALLERRRDALNARFIRLGRGRDPSTFLHYLARTVDPIVAAGGAESALLALFDLGLAAGSRGLLGTHEPSAFEVALVEHLPRFGEHFRKTPAELVALVANAFERLSRELSTERACAWLAQLASVSHFCPTRRALLEAGLSIAWREGLAEARRTVLSLKLDTAVSGAIFGVPTLDGDPARRFCRPGRAGFGPLEIVAEIGGFTGFGGVFRRPPTLRAVQGRIIATDDTTAYEICADAFGARVRSSHALDGPDEGDSISLAADGTLAWMSASGNFPALLGARSVVAIDGMAAVTLPTSHIVFVLGRTEARD